MNILIVDDSQTVLTMVSKMIAKHQHSVLTAVSPHQALTVIQSHKIEMIIMDIEMPEMSGFELTRIIRQRLSKWIPIIFLSANDSDDYLIQGIESGGDDYLIKPVKEVILDAKIRAMARIAQMQNELDIANKKLAKLSTIDELTQIVNRRGLFEQLEKQWKIYQRTQSELSLLIIDIDYFKAYNDALGHQQGDECLHWIAQLLSNLVKRSADIVGRYGGEEFIMVLPHTPLIGARFKAKEILAKLQTEQRPHPNSLVAPYITVSIGIASSCQPIRTTKELVEFADKALYEAKKQGRNQYKII